MDIGGNSRTSEESGVASGGEGGFTVTELVVVVVIGVMLMLALFLFVTRGVDISREQFQQVLTTEDARVQLERMSDTIRNARDISQDDWLVLAGATELTVNSNIDADQNDEQVRYFLQGTELIRGVAQAVGATEILHTVARTVVNTSQGEPIFRYYDANEVEILPASATSLNVERIGMTLFVDAGLESTPGVAEVETILFPREGALGGDADALWPAEIHLPGNPPTGDTARIRITDPSTGTFTDEYATIVELGDGRVVTFADSFYTNINFQGGVFQGDPEGWYAWIGPILVGKSGSQEYYETDKVPIAQVCTGADLGVLLATCPERTVSKASLSYSYQPILTYMSTFIGETAYVRDIFFDGP